MDVRLYCVGSTWYVQSLDSGNLIARMEGKIKGEKSARRFIEVNKYNLVIS